MNDTEQINTARIVRVFNHGANVQVMCADDLGLLSLYFRQETFSLFNRDIHKAGLKLKDLPIQFDSRTVRIQDPVKKKVLSYKL